MGVARDIEQRLEGMVEGFFSRLFRSGLQPVEIGRRITREMGENKTVSVNRIYAPNEFHVAIGAEDWERFSSMEAGLQREFTDLIIETAKENHWNLMGMPKIAFEEAGSLGKGQYRVDSSLTADPEANAPPVSTRSPNADDLSATGAISLGEAERLGLQSAGAKLEVIAGGKIAEEISITRTPVTIGRMSTNDVVLSDSNVSRKHAEIRREGGKWLLVDLGSTNGSTVNNKLAREHSLEDGDRMTFGTSELVFRLTGG
jgi:hypothetical protein